MQRALLIEDDARLAALLKEYLAKSDIEVTIAPDGERGLVELAARPAFFDVVLLDLMLPGMDGLAVCRSIRGRAEHAQLPVLMLTAKGDDVDKIVGLELGADDYLAKPFNPRELLARIRAVLRRSAPGTGGAVPARGLRLGELHIEPEARRVTVAGQAVVLTSFEFELLLQLGRAAGRVLSREQLMEALRGTAFEAFDRSIDVHISKLRAKIEADPRNPVYIKTIRGVGYMLARED